MCSEPCFTRRATVTVPRCGRPRVGVHDGQARSELSSSSGQYKLLSCSVIHCVPSWCVACLCVNVFSVGIGWSWHSSIFSVCLRGRVVVRWFVVVRLCDCVCSCVVCVRLIVRAVFVCVVWGASIPLCVICGCLLGTWSWCVELTQICFCGLRSVIYSSSQFVIWGCAVVSGCLCCVWWCGASMPLCVLCGCCLVLGRGGWCLFRFLGGLWSAAVFNL